MKKLKLCAVVFLATFCCSSCLRTAYYIGEARPKEKVVKVGTESFHHHFIGGLVAGKNATIDANEYSNGADNYVVRTSISFADMLIGDLTFGIYTPTKTTWFMSADEINKLSKRGKEDKQ